MMINREKHKYRKILKLPIRNFIVTSFSRGSIIVSPKGLTGTCSSYKKLNLSDNKPLIPFYSNHIDGQCCSIIHRPQFLLPVIISKEGF